jgi:hypothetical protein
VLRRKLLAGLGAAAIGGVTASAVGQAAPAGLNLGVLFSAKGPVRINLCAMAWPISRRLRLGITADVLSGNAMALMLASDPPADDA